MTKTMFRLRFVAAVLLCALAVDPRILLAQEEDPPMPPAAPGLPETSEADPTPEAEAGEPAEPAVRVPPKEAAEAPDREGEESVTEGGASVRSGWGNAEGSEIVLVGSDAELAKGETASDVVVVFGNAAIDGTVLNGVVVVLGKVRLNGEVFGDFVAPLTAVELGPDAHVHGDLVAVGGSLVMDPGARVDGESVKLTWDELEQIPGVHALKSVAVAAGDWAVKGPLLGRPLPHQWGWWWWVAIGLGVVYLMCGLVLQGPVAAGVKVMQERPVAAFFAGIMGYLGVCILLMLLLVTAVGLFVVPFLFVAALAAQLLGKAVVCQGLGVQLGRQTGAGFLTRPLPALLAGLGVLTLIAVMPFLGLLAAFLIAPLGFGAVLLATFQALRRERSPEPIGPALAATPAQGFQGAAVRTPILQRPPPVIPTAAAPVTVAAGELESLPRAGFWIRLAATALDMLLVLVALAVVGLMDYYLVFWLVYHVGLWAWRGTTIGGIVCGLKIVRRDGLPLSFAVALVRSLSCVLSAVALFLGFFWAGWSAEKVAWHDLVAGTLVVRVPRGMPLI